MQKMKKGDNKRKSLSQGDKLRAYVEEFVVNASGTVLLEEVIEYVKSQREYTRNTHQSLKEPVRRSMETIYILTNSFP